MQYRWEETFKNVGIIANRAGDLYQKRIKSKIDESIKPLEKILNIFVGSYEKEFKLVRGNDSSKEIRLYEMSCRSKSRESLVEKIVRNQEFYELDTEDENELEKVILEKNDDLMGLRFLVSLSCDCEKVYNVFLKHSVELEDKDIVFINLRDNPQKMKNKRQIYRLKGKYQELPFELQIKSKVDSAWADIEHMLFYKDYQFSYIKKTNEGVMNKIGDLLDKVDELMIQIRDSQDVYEEEKQRLEFNNRLEKRYGEFVREELVSKSILRDCRDVLWMLYTNYFSPQEMKLINDQMEESPSNMVLREMKLKSGIDNSNFIQNYNQLKVKGIELILIEHIYSDWINGSRKSTIIDENLCLEEIKKYYSIIIKAFITTKLGFILHTLITEGELDNFAKYVATELTVLMTKTNFAVSKQLFVFDENILYMLFCFWKVMGQIQGDEDVDQDDLIKKNVTSIVFGFLLCESTDQYSNELKKLYYEKDGSVIEKILQHSFINSLELQYNCLKRTRSGKKPKDDIIRKLFEAAVTLLESEE